MKLFVATILLAAHALAAPSRLGGHGSHHSSGSHHQSSGHHGSGVQHFVAAGSHHSPVVVSHHSSGSHGGHHSGSGSHQIQTSASSDTFFVGQASGNQPRIVKDFRTNPDQFGNYNYEIETDDGTVREETGKPGSSGAVVQTGSYSFTHPSGQTFELRYVADEGGYRVESPFLPPLPAFVLEQIAFARDNPQFN